MVEYDEFGYTTDELDVIDSNSANDPGDDIADSIETESTPGGPDDGDGL